MSTSNPSRRSAGPLFLILMGTLTFSLSSLPGYSRDLAGVESLSSETATSNTCGALVNQIDSTGRVGDGTCQITGGSKDVVGRVKLEYTDIGHLDDQNNFTKTKGWQYTLEIICKDTKSCDDSGTLTSPVREPLTSFREVTARALKKFHEKAGEAQDKIREAKRLKADIEDCVKEPEEPHEEIPEGRERDMCYVDRMADMDTDQAAEYYQDKLQGHLEGLVGSDKLKDQREATAILKALGETKAGGSFVKDSITDLKSYREAKDQVKAEQAQVLAMQNEIMATPEGPLRNQKMALLKKALGTMKSQQAWMDANFANLKKKRGAEDLPAALTNPFEVNALVTNLDDYQARLDEIYKNVVYNDALYTSPQAAAAVANPNSVIQNGDPRTNSRGGGTPVTSTMAPAAPASPAAAAGAASTASAPSAAATGIPRLGSPVGRR